MKKVVLFFYFNVCLFSIVHAEVVSKKLGNIGKTPAQGVMRDRTLGRTVPPAESDIAFWFRADEGVYSDSGTTLATNGLTVQKWEDQSGNGRHLYQHQSGLRPTYNTSVLSGKPGLNFTADLLTSTTSINTPVTMFVVFFYKEISVSTGIIVMTSLDVFETGRLQTNVNGELGYADNTGGFTYTTITPLVQGSTYTVTVYFDSGGAHYLRVNNNAKVTSSGRNTSALANLILGNNTNTTTPRDINVYEFIGYSKALTTIEEDAILDYLQTKWAHY